MDTVGKSRKKATLACVNCRNRRIKCDLSTSNSCFNCRKLKIECLKVSTDRRKGRYNADHVKNMEARILKYEETIEALRQNFDEGNKIMASLVNHDNDSYNRNGADPIRSEQADDPLAKVGANSNINKILTKTHSGIFGANVNRPKLINDNDGLLPTLEDAQFLKPDKFKEGQKFTVYGPTSVYDNESLPNKNLSTENDLSYLNKNSIIVECVKLFFKWQYPDMHLFLFREKFLLDFANANADYASTELVYSICAMGSLISEDRSLREQSFTFYTASKESLIHKLDSPSIPSMQAYLLLGLYDIYNARNNSGWLLTGIGLRMGLDIGFQLNPLSWSVRMNEKVSEFTVQVRSRIFWGSFMADRFIGLILGRPSTLKANDSSIPESVNLPSIEWVDDFTYPGIEENEDTKATYIDISNPLKVIMKLITISDEMLCNLFSIDQKDAGSMLDLTSKLKLLEKYNEKLLEWKQKLPSKLQWDKKELSEKGHDPTVMFWRYFYYMVLLCLNRPFLEVSRASSPSAAGDSMDALKICSHAIEDLHIAIFSFVRTHGFNRCSILILYSCIICLSIILLSSSGGNFKESQLFKNYFFEFMTVLSKSSATWKLGETSYNRIKKSLVTEYKFNYDAEFLQYKLQVRQQSSNSLVALLEEENSLCSSEDYNPSENGNQERSPNTNENYPIGFSGFGGPPVFMNSEMFAEWESLFPDYMSTTPHND